MSVKSNHIVRSIPLLTAVIALVLGAALRAAPTDDDGPARPAVQVAKVPQIVAMVPENAAGALIAPNLGELDKRAAAMAKALDMEGDAAAAPLTTMFKQTGLLQGVDMKRGGAIVMPDLNLMGEPQVILVVPVADEAKFKANFRDLEAVEGAEGVMQGSVAEGNMGQAFLRMADGYAMLSERQQGVAGYKTGTADGKLWQRLGAVGQRQLQANHATVYVNLERVGPMVAPLVQMGLMQAKVQMKNNPAQAKAMGGPEAAGVFLDMYGELVKTIFNDGSALTMGLTLDEAGVAVRYGVQFKADTAAAKVFSPRVGPSVTLDRLPSAPTLAAAAMDNRAVDMTPVVKALSEAAKKLGEDSPMHGIVSGYANSIKMMSLIDQGSIAWYAPDKADGEAGVAEILDLAFVYTSDKPAELAKANVEYNEKMMEAMSELAKAQGADDQAIEKMRNAMKIQTGVAKLDGHQVDRLTMDLEALSDQPGAGPIPEPFKGDLVMSWLTTENAIVGASGKEMTRLKQTLEAADGSGKLGQRSQFTMLRRHLPDDRCAEAFIDIEALGSAMMAAAGDPDAAEFKGVGSMAVSMTSRAGGAGATAFLPTSAVKGIVEGVQGFMGKMMPGGRQMPGGGF